MSFVRESKIFYEHSGILRASQAHKAGIHPQVISRMKSKGVLESIARGLYRLKGSAVLSQPDIVTIAMKVPQGVLCLISALAFYEVTTEISRAVNIALKAGSQKPKVDYPPTKYYWISEPAFSAGIEAHKVDGVEVRVYSLEKTVTDCFKFRNKIGMDVAIAALKECITKKNCKIDEIMKFAKINRVEKVMSPYLQALV